MRPHKARLNNVVHVNAPSDGLPYYGVVIGYRDDRKWGRYQVVETDPLGRSPRGAAKWVDSTEFISTDRRSIKAGRIYRKNQKHMLGDTERDCRCQCCPHQNQDGYLDEHEG